MKRLLAVIALGLAAQTAQAADPVGRIFFTPEQRTQLDALRTKKAVASQVRDEPIPETVTYNGIVRSSDGKTTVWINDEALSESGLSNKQSIVGSVGRDGRITLQAPQAAVQLKVGQSATLFSGKVAESFTTKRAESEKTKPPATGAKPAPAQTSREIPPELLEALRQAAARDKSAMPSTTEQQKAPAKQ
jgi:hypothetical protein